MRSCPLVLLSVAVCAASAWSAETRVYRTKNRPVAELASLAEAALGDEGHVVVDARTASLVMVGKPAALDRAVALLRSQDRAVDTVLVDYWLERRAVLDSTDLRVDWAIEGAGFRIGRLAVPGSGLRIALGATRSAGDSKRGGTLRLMSGGSGYIVTGAALPIVVTTHYSATTEFLHAESGFEASASVLGSGDVALTLQPFDGRFVAGGVRYTAAATQLILSPGETVVVGSIGHEGVAKGVDRLGALSRQEASDKQVLFVSVSVEGPSRR